MKKEYSDFQPKLSKINLLDTSWLEKSMKLLKDNHLICVGKNNDLQWFGTSLIQ